MPTVQPTCTCAAPCLSPVSDQRPRPARETIRVMRAADAKENCMQRFSPPSLDHNVDVHQHCTRQREHGCAAVVVMAKRYEATRTQGDEPRKRESASASSCSERTATERGARKEPTKATQRRFAPSGSPRPGCALYETTRSVTEAIPTKKKKRSAGSSDLFVGRNSETHTQVTRGVGTTNTHGSGRERFSAAKPHQPWTRDPRPRPVGVTTALTSQANVQNAQLADRSGRDWTHSEEAAVAL